MTGGTQKLDVFPHAGGSAHYYVPFAKAFSSNVKCIAVQYLTEQANTRFLDRMTELLDDSVCHAGNCATSRSYRFAPSGEAPLFRPTSVHGAVAEHDRFPLRDCAIT